MNQTEQPQIQILRIFLAHAEFKLADGPLDLAKLNTQYHLEVTLGIQSNAADSLETSLNVKCINAELPKSVNIFVRVVGMFKGDPEHLKLFAPNSGGLLMPYARAYITSLTSWGPMNPVIIPPMNVTQAALEQLSKPTTQAAPALPEGRR